MKPGRNLRTCLMQHLARVSWSAGSAVRSGHVAQDFVQSGLENPHEQRLQSLSGQHASLLDWFRVKIFFLIHCLKLPSFSFCPLFLVLTARSTEDPGFVLLLTLLRLGPGWDDVRSPYSSLSCRLNNLQVPSCRLAPSQGSRSLCSCTNTSWPQAALRFSLLAFNEVSVSSFL